MSMPAEALPMTGFFQVAYVTNDFARAQKVWSDRYGIGRFGLLPGAEMGLDDGGSIHLNLGLAWVGSVMIEVIEPIDGAVDIYRSVLPAGPEFAMTMHHLGFKMPSPDLVDAVRSTLEKSQHPIAISGGRDDGSKYFYADARASLGHYLEYLYISPPREEFFTSLPRY